MNLSPFGARRFAMIALAFSAMIASPVAPVTLAADQPATPHLADAPALPVSHSFSKGEPGPEYGGPYSLTLKNTSDKALSVKATIHQSVVSHNRPKTFELPAHEIAAGASWTISDLAVDDRVVVTADGFAPLDVKVPAAK